MTNFWMIRSGKNGVYVNNFLKSGIVAIECIDLGAISQNITKEEIADRYMRLNPLQTKIQARNKLTQYDRFIRLISIDDYVITNDPNEKKYYIGLIQSEAFWSYGNSSNLMCTRSVKWEMEIAKKI